MREHIRRFDTWLFERGSPLPLSLMRVGFGIMTAWICGTFLMRADQWLGPESWLGPTPPHSLFFQYNGDCRALAVLTLLCGVFLALGLATRATSWASWIGLTLLQSRLEPVLCGGDVVLQFMLFFVALGRSGEALSLDRYFWGRRGPLSSIPLWPQKLAAYHVSLIYGCAALHKLVDPCWRDGTALFYGLQYEDFLNFPLPGFARSPEVTALLTYFTVALEIALGLLPWIRSNSARRTILMLGMGLHLGIGYSMFIPYFSPVMILTYLSWLRADELVQLKENLVGRFTSILNFRRPVHA